MDKFNKQVLCGVAVVIIAAWLSYISVCTVNYDRRIGILESVIVYVITLITLNSSELEKISNIEFQLTIT